MNKITKIEVGKRNKDRVNVFIDDEFAFACFGELVYNYNLTKGKVVNVEELKEVIEQEEYLKCKSASLKMMERSYKTEKEVRNKLLTKEFSETSIQKAIEFLKEYNFINDEKYAQMYIKDKIKLSGKNKIKYSLIRKGVDEEFIKSNLDMVDEDSQLEVAEKLAYKKYAVISKNESDKYKLSNKLIRFLMTKGYDYDTCKKITKKIVELDFND